MRCAVYLRKWISTRASAYGAGGRLLDLRPRCFGFEVGTRVALLSIASSNLKGKRRRGLPGLGFGTTLLRCQFHSRVVVRPPMFGKQATGDVSR